MSFVKQDDVGERGLPELLDMHTKHIMGKIHTGLVCRVESFNAQKRSANVQPVIKGRYQTGERFRLPILPNVPVGYPGGSSFEITWPLAAGDYVFVSFSERSLDEWKALGGIDVEPQDLRRFNLSDGVIVAFLDPPGQASPVQEDAMLVGDPNGAFVRLRSGGKVAIGTSSADLLSILDSLLTALDAFTTATSLAGVEPTLAPASTALKTSVGVAKLLLEQIKDSP